MILKDQHIWKLEKSAYSKNTESPPHEVLCVWGAAPRPCNVWNCLAQQEHIVQASDKIISVF